MLFSMDLEWDNQGATVSKTTKEHRQVMFFKGEVLFLSQSFGLMPASCSCSPLSISGFWKCCFLAKSKLVFIQEMKQVRILSWVLPLD